METLLIIEDEINQQLLYRLELEGEGYRVLTTGDTREALEAVQLQHPDLVVLDPGLNGVENDHTLRAIRSLDPDVPVVIYTGYSLSPDLDRRFGLADAYLTKSSDLDPLKRAILNTLDHNFPARAFPRRGSRPCPELGNPIPEPFVPVGSPARL